MTRLDDLALDRLFHTARSRNGWTAQPVSDALLRELYETAKWPPTAANSNPARFVFVKSAQAKTRLAPLVSSANQPKVMAAPVTAIIGHDLNFAERIPQLMPHNPGAKAWFADPESARETAVRNGTLQGAYLILAARALGLDAGPMSGFDQAGVDREFFAGTSTVSNFICGLGYGSEENLYPRLPRLEFEDACDIL